MNTSQISLEHGYTILLLAGSFMLIFSLAIQKFVIGFKALNYFWLADSTAKELPYFKFLVSVFSSSLFDSNMNTQRLLAISKLILSLRLFLFAFFILLFSRNGGFEFVESFIAAMSNAN
mgnify:CR=1 FL=1